MHEGDFVKITHLNHLPQKLLLHPLGMRQEGAIGRISIASVPGFDSDAIRVEHCDDHGEQNGSWGIYFPGEFEPTFVLA